MPESNKKPPGPDSTLVDPDDAGPTPVEPIPAMPVGKRPTNPELAAVGNPDTAPNAPITNPNTTPMSPTKRPTRSGLPAQQPHEAPTVPPDAPPPAPDRNRVSGKQQREPVSGKLRVSGEPVSGKLRVSGEPVSDRMRVSGKRPVPPEPKQPLDLPEPPTTVTPQVPTAPETPLARAAERSGEPVSDRMRVSGKRPVPQQPPHEPPTTVTPVATAAPNNLPPLVEQSTRLNAMPHAPHAKVGPTGTLDTDSNPAAPAPLPESTFSGDEAQPTNPTNPPGNRTQDFKPLTPTKTLAGLDEAQFRRAVWGLAFGALLLVSLIFVWVMVKFDDVPADPGKATKLGPAGGAKPAVKPGPAPIVAEAEPTTIEQTIDAGDGETRTVLAAAGTVRIVSEPEANALVDGKDLGVTPVLVTLPAGKNPVLLENKKLGFKRTVTVDVVSNEQTAARFAFSKGWIELDAPSGAKVLVDGRPVTGTHIQLWEGTHKVEAMFDDKRKSRASRTAEVAAGMTTSVHFDAPSIADE